MSGGLNSWGIIGPGNVGGELQRRIGEPGGEGPEAVIRSEAEGDIPKKVGIVFNTLGLSQNPLDWKKLKFRLAPADIATAVEQASSRRFVTSIYQKDAVTPDPLDRIGGFDIEHDGWRVIGGFGDVKSNPALSTLTATEGPTNGFVIGLGTGNSRGVDSLSGPGAGAGPTVSSMLYDSQLVRQNNTMD